MGNAEFMVVSTKTRIARGKGRPTTRGSVGKDALVAAAREALKQKPPGELTLNEIAQIAGVDPALIRYYFGQLSELFAEAATEITRELRGRLAALIAQKGSARESLQRRILVYLDVFRTNPNYHRLIIESVHLSDNPNRQTVLRLLRQSLEELEDLVREGSSSGELKAVDARFLQLAIAAMCEFFFSARPIFQGIFGAEADDPSFVEAYARFVTTLVSESPGKTAKAKPKRKSRVRNGR
jgi:AcrR family transcriptional regulator